MTTSVNLISKNRLGRIPKHLQLAHEYSFFLHDESTRLLVEYEGARAHFVNFEFNNKAEAKAYRKLEKATDVLTAMRVSGYAAQARRLIMNQITMAMASDCLHHIYEALRCLEKRKVIVALNLLRKPLTDNLLYFSWMLSDEDKFYEAFTTKSPKGITSSILKSQRMELLANALEKTEVADVLNAQFINETLFEKSNPSGLQKLFQHAVHLVTVQNVELETTPENFNFIFKNYADDDLYELVYDVFPHILLYLSHIIFGLFERIAVPEKGSKKAFQVRSILGLYLVEGGENASHALYRLSFLNRLECAVCKSTIKISHYNAARLILTESYRCAKCRYIQPFPFSWIF
jgi:hypothetical protein